MSAKYLIKTMQIAITNNQRSVLSCLAYIANENGVAWISRDELCERTGLKKTAISKYVQELIDLALVSKKVIGNANAKGRASNVYLVNYSAMTKFEQLPVRPKRYKVEERVGLNINDRETDINGINDRETDINDHLSPPDGPPIKNIHDLDLDPPIVPQESFLDTYIAPRDDQGRLIPHKLPSNYTPNEMTLFQLKNRGVPLWFLDKALMYFVVHYHNQETKKDVWDSSFVKWTMQDWIQYSTLLAKGETPYKYLDPSIPQKEAQHGKQPQAQSHTGRRPDQTVPTWQTGDTTIDEYVQRLSETDGRDPEAIIAELAGASW